MQDKELVSNAYLLLKIGEPLVEGEITRVALRPLAGELASVRILSSMMIHVVEIPARMRAKRAITSTAEDSTMTYTANTNSAGRQTWSSRPVRTAILRRTIATSHAATISSEIGAT